MKVSSRHMRSIELFSGAGGLALGTHRAGFHHLAVVERDHDACDTLRLNRERRAITGIDWPIAETDVKMFDYAPYRVSGEIDLLAGGAPCQPFSLGGKHAGEADPRNMFPEVLRAVRELQPRAVLLENVRGIVRENFRPYFDYILAQLAFRSFAGAQTKRGENMPSDWKACVRLLIEWMKHIVTTLRGSL